MYVYIFLHVKTIPRTHNVDNVDISTTTTTTTNNNNNITSVGKQTTHM